jgi:hypothetical protein
MDGVEGENATLDFTEQHWYLPADKSGTTECKSDVFSADSGLDNQACFCEGTPVYDNYCSPDDKSTYIGCFDDEEFDPDFEELLYEADYTGEDEVVLKDASQSEKKFSGAEAS